MSHLMTRLARRCSGVAVAGSLAVAALVVPAAPASAARIPITADEQDYYSYYYLGQLHASGYTGRGVTIGLLDGPVNTNIPELQGANIQYMSRCDVDGLYSDSLPRGATTGTFCVIARANAQRILSVSALYDEDIVITSTPSLSASSMSTDVSE